MFGIPGKAAVTLTPAATRQIARLMEREGSSGPAHRRQEGRLRGHGIHHGLRHLGQSAGRSGGVDGARVMIAPMAQMFLIGTEIDYETSLLEVEIHLPQPQRGRGLRLR